MKDNQYEILLLSFACEYVMGKVFLSATMLSVLKLFYFVVLKIISDSGIEFHSLINVFKQCLNML